MSDVVWIDDPQRGCRVFTFRSRNFLGGMDPLIDGATGRPVEITNEIVRDCKDYHDAMRIAERLERRIVHIQNKLCLMEPLTLDEDF